MRKTLIIALSAGASLTLAGCSQKTQENADKTAESVGEDVGGAAAEASHAVEGAADAVGDAAAKGAAAISGAADKAAVAADRAGDKIEEGADKARARVHDETAPDKR
jgi:uncharacterized lipoprotein NlpE involved in copper resistance